MTWVEITVVKCRRRGGLLRWSGGGWQGDISNALLLKVSMSAFPGTWKRGGGAFKTSSSKENPAWIVGELSIGPVELLVAASPISLLSPQGLDEQA